MGDTDEAPPLPTTMDDELRAIARVERPVELVAPGTQVGRYAIVRQLGAGGMGVVYEAADRALERRVALKLVKPRGVSVEQAQARVRREARAMARVPTACGVVIHEIGEHGEQLFIAMELVTGGTLRSWMATRPSWQAVVEMMTRVGRSLAAAHAAGIVHRDFKPENVLLGGAGEVRIADFGLARALATSEPVVEEPEWGDGSRLAGTPAYMAPEQRRGEPTDERADLFSYCVTFWEALHGERPFAGASADALRDAVLSGHVRPPAASDVPGALDDVLRRGLQIDPAARWSTMDAALSVIAKVTRPRRRWWIAALVLVALVAFVVILRRDERSSTITIAHAGRPVLAVLGIADGATRDDDLAERLGVELGAGDGVRLVASAATAEVSAGWPLGPPNLAQLVVLRAQLGCDLVVSGARHDGRLAVEVYDTSSGGVVAAISVEGGTPANLAAAAAVALRQHVPLGDAPPEALAAALRVTPSRPEAARLLVQGRALLARGEAGAARMAFEQALVIEPDQPMIYAGLAEAWNMLQYDRRELVAAQRAFELAAWLPREQRLQLEARYREALRDWSHAVELRRALATFYPDDLSDGLELVRDLHHGRRNDEARVALARLRQLPLPDGADPRIDLLGSELAPTAEALGLADRAAATAAARGQPAMIARARLRTCKLLGDADRIEPALAACRDALQRFVAAGDRSGAALANTQLAGRLIVGQRGDEAQQALDAAQAQYRELGSEAGVAEVSFFVGAAAFETGDLARTEASFERAAALYHAANEPRSEALVRANLATALAQRNKLAAAKQAYGEAIAEARAEGDRELEGFALSNFAILLGRLGEAAEQTNAAERAVAVSRELGLKRELAFALDHLGNAQLAAGSPGPARQAFEEALGLRDALGLTGGPSRQNLAEVALDERQLDRAEPLVREAIAEFHAKHETLRELYALDLLARVLFEQHKPEALIVVDQERALAEQLGFDEQRQNLAPTLARARAARGDAAGAIAELRAEIERTVAHGFVSASLEQRRVLAELELARGERAKAHHLLVALRRDAEALGAGQMVRAVDRVR